ncbi:MAG: hydrogenase maturation protease [Actinomycetota bacterium]|nr:hydrogenase maturation protease [Actinomycetota bacterium]
MQRTSPEVPRILVAGIGNIFLADDGFGCEVVRHLGALEALPGVRLVDYGIRGMHLAYDLLDGWDLAILVDAVPDRGDPGSMEVLELSADMNGSAGLDAHGMDPASVLCSVVALGGELPRICLVGVQVAEIGERMGLSDRVEAAVVPAATAVQQLVREHLATWSSSFVQRSERVG